MEKDTTTYVGLDDSKRKLVVAILRPGEREPEQREMPKEPHLIQPVFRRLTREGAVAVCYEAGVSGYDLYRQITACGAACQVIAPALTPRRPGQRIKTDRRDAAKLVRLFRAGELTAIHVPDEAEEAVRDLLRCREGVRRDVLRWRHRLLKFLDRHGRLYVTGKNWSQRHWTWIRAQRFDLAPRQRTFDASLFALEQTLAHQAELDKEIAALAEQPPYREPVGWLRCFRGIDTLSAMILLAEIVDFQRFPHPRELMAYLGLVPSEYSSGETQRRGAITKAGNTHARRVLVEAAWHYRHRPTLGRALAARAEGQPSACRTHAWRAQQRLHRRYDPSGFPDQRVPMHVLEGVGDLYGLLRGDMPARPQSRTQVLEARAGESEYIRYDRAIADGAVRWLREEAPAETKPWCLFVGFVTPHFPLVVPDQYWNLYDPDALPLPVQYAPEHWSRHPVLELKRRQEALDAPFDEKTIRTAMRAYYGLVSFLDAQVGLVLKALRAAGLQGSTRIIYSTDHGEMLGEHGLWWKSAMYESAVAVPLMVAGPDVPAGRVVGTNAMLVDVFPSILEAVGARPAPEDRDLPGRSLWALAREDVNPPRTAFSEYHAIFSPTGIFMVRNARYKYVHYVGYPPQLFDLVADPEERRDLSADRAHADARAACEHELRALCDPEAVDRRARADQRRRLEAAGGADAVLGAGVKIPYTPAPAEFEPAPVEARERRQGPVRLDG